MKRRSYFTHGFLAVFFCVLVGLFVLFLTRYSGMLTTPEATTVWAAIIFVFTLFFIIVISLFLRTRKKHL